MHLHRSQSHYMVHCNMSEAKVVANNSEAFGSKSRKVRGSPARVAPAPFRPVMDAPVVATADPEPAPINIALAAALAPPTHVPDVEFTEAVTSPAINSDIHQAAAASPAAPSNEGPEDMATIAPPTSPTDAAEKTQAMFGDVSSRMKTAMEKSSRMGEDMVDFAKGNVEAMVASARVAAKAGETIGQEAADYSRRHLESATAAFKSFATVKSPTELFQLQSEYAKASFDSAVAEASKLSESMMKFAGDIAQPLSNRYAMAAEKFKSTAL